jgi:hypothetical protein
MGWAYLTREEAQRTIELNTLTPPPPPAVSTQPLQMLRLDRNSLNTEGGEILREDVDELRCRRDMEDADLTDGNLPSDEMNINLHMLRALMLNEVSGEVHGADVVTVDE